MQQTRLPPRVLDEPVETVRLVIELSGDPEDQLSAAVTVDLSAELGGRKLEDVVRMLRALGKRQEAKPPAEPKPRSRPPSKPQAHLLPIDAPNLKPVRVLQDIVVGRARDCDLSIRSPKVSRKHFRLFSSDGGFTIEDLGSVNRTWINGVPIEAPVALKAGDVIMAGDVRFEYRIA